MSEAGIRFLLIQLVAELKHMFISSELAVSADLDGCQLISLSIVGRPLCERRIENVMDIDTIVVLRRSMTRQHYIEIDRIFAELQNHSSPEVGISYCIADGPIKPLPVKPLNIFFHVLLHTIETYRTSPLVLVKTSWQTESRCLLCDPVSEIQTLPALNIEQIIEGHLGIRHCCSLINAGGSACLKWQKQSTDELKLVLSPFDFTERYEIVEFCFYSVLRAASNALRWSIGMVNGIGIGIGEMRMFADMFPNLRCRRLAERYCYEKAAMRAGRWYPTTTQKDLRIEESQEFLWDLDRELSACFRESSRIREAEFEFCSNRPNLVVVPQFCTS